MSYTVPGDKLYHSPCQFIYHETLPVQPLPPVSLHVPTKVLLSFVQASLPPLLVQVGAVLSIFTVTPEHVALFPALSYTVPGLTFPFVLLLIVLLTFSLQPLPPVSLHVPFIVLFPFVQLLFPPLLLHLGAVLSIFTVTPEHVALFPALSYTVPGLTFPFVLLLIVLLTFSLQPLPPVSLHVPFIVLLPLVQLLFPPLLLHVGFVLSTFTVTLGHVTLFPALSYTFPGLTLPFVLLSIFLVTLPSQPLPPVSLHVPF